MRTTRWLAAGLIALVLAVPVAADEMQDAMARADALALFRQIDLQREQARQMIGPLQRINEIVEGYNSQRKQTLDRMGPTLREARRQLVAGDELSAEMVSALEDYQQSRQAAELEAQRAVNAEMQALAEILTPEQNELLDWTAPGSIRPQEQLEGRLRLQQIAMGRIQEAAQMLDEVKHLDAFNYVTGRQPIINDYLALYYDPQTVQFEQAVEIALAYTGNVRMLDEDQWGAQALDIAAGMVEELGLMPTMESEQRSDAISWSTLFRIMTHKQTLEVVRDVAR
ncbi:MAG: hypothetical protein ACOCX2_07600 [Armatimonadota bacterium]